jgi:hypothetical protein
VDAGQWTVKQCWWAVDGGKGTVGSVNVHWRCMGSRLWTEDSGQWAVDCGQRTVGSRLWTEDSGQWAVDCGQRTVGSAGLEKTRFFFLKPSPVGFLFFFWFFWVFLPGREGL